MIRSEAYFLPLLQLSHDDCYCYNVHSRLWCDKALTPPWLYLLYISMVPDFRIPLIQKLFLLRSLSIAGQKKFDDVFTSVKTRYLFLNYHLSLLHLPSCSQSLPLFFSPLLHVLSSILPFVYVFFVRWPDLEKLSFCQVTLHSPTGIIWKQGCWFFLYKKKYHNLNQMNLNKIKSI